MNYSKHKLISNDVHYFWDKPLKAYVWWLFDIPYKEYWNSDLGIQKDVQNNYKYYQNIYIVLKPN